MEMTRGYYRKGIFVISTSDLGKALNQSSTRIGRFMGEISDCGISKIRDGRWDISKLDLKKLNIIKKGMM